MTRSKILITSLVLFFLISCSKEKYNISLVVDNSRTKDVFFEIEMNSILIWKDSLKKSKIAPNYTIKKLFIQKDSLYKFKVTDLINGSSVQDSFYFNNKAPKSLIFDFNSELINEYVLDEKGDSTLIYKRDELNIFRFDSTLNIY